MLLIVDTVPVAAQARPPREWHAGVLMDVGHVPVPPCTCIPSPLTLPPVRLGAGFSSGPGARDEAPPLSTSERKRQAEIDADNVANLPAQIARALEGDAGESFSIALLFMQGTAVQRNDEEVARWFYLAATQGSQDAYLHLAHRYHAGRGVRQDDKVAAYWFRASASAGDGHGMVALGLLYAAGRGVPQDWATAVRWWRRARSERRVPIAARLLGDAYACGLGIERSPERAMRSFREAAAGGELTGHVHVGHMYTAGCAGPNDEAAYAAYQAAADSGDAEAQIGLSELYFRGAGVEQSAYWSYVWAMLAERRLQPGDLQTQASAHAARAKQLLGAIELELAETLIQALIDGAS
jgi:TPR repeat protein